MEEEVKAEEAPKSLLEGYGREPDPYAVLHEAMCEVGSELSRLYREDEAAAPPRSDPVAANQLCLMAQAKNNPAATLARQKSSRRVRQPQGTSELPTQHSVKPPASLHTVQLFNVPTGPYAPYKQAASYAEEFFKDAYIQKEWDETVSAAPPPFSISAVDPESPHVAFHLPDASLYSPDSQQNETEDDEDDGSESDAALGQQTQSDWNGHASGKVSKPPALKVGALSNLLDLFAAEQSPGPLIKPRQLKVEAALNVPKGLSLAKHKDAYAARPTAPQPAAAAPPSRYESPSKPHVLVSGPTQLTPAPPPVYLTGSDSVPAPRSNSVGRTRPGQATGASISTASPAAAETAWELGRLTLGPQPPASLDNKASSFSSAAIPALVQESSQGSFSATSSPARLPPKPRSSTKPKPSPGLESSASEIMGLTAKSSLSSRTSPMRGGQLEPLQAVPATGSPAQSSQSLTASRDNASELAPSSLLAPASHDTPQSSSRHVTPTKPRLAPVQPSLGGIMAVLSTQLPSAAPSAANLLSLPQSTPEKQEPETPPLKRCTSPNPCRQSNLTQRLDAAGPRNNQRSSTSEPIVGAADGASIGNTTQAALNPRLMAASHILPSSLPPTPPRPAAAPRPRNAASLDTHTGVSSGQADSLMRSSPAVMGPARTSGTGSMFRSRDPSPVNLRASSNHPSRDNSPVVHNMSREHHISSDIPQMSIMRSRSSTGGYMVMNDGEGGSRHGSHTGSGFLPPIAAGSRHASRDPSPANQAAARKSSRDPSPLYRKASGADMPADDMTMVPAVPGMRRATERQMMEAAHEIKYGPAWKPGGLNPMGKDGAAGNSAKFSDAQPRVPRGAELLQSSAPLPSLKHGVLHTVPGQEFKIDYEYKP